MPFLLFFKICLSKRFSSTLLCVNAIKNEHFSLSLFITNELLDRHLRVSNDLSSFRSTRASRSSLWRRSICWADWTKSTRRRLWSSCSNATTVMGDSERDRTQRAIRDRLAKILNRKWRRRRTQFLWRCIAVWEAYAFWIDWKASTGTKLPLGWHRDSALVEGSMVSFLLLLFLSSLRKLMVKRCIIKS